MIPLSNMEKNKRTSKWTWETIEARTWPAWSPCSCARVRSAGVTWWIAPFWSVCRGLARREAEYKALLGNCDLPRRHDTDGRGNLSEEALIAFCRFFLATCTDQVEFMARLIDPQGLRERIVAWAQVEIAASRLPPRSDRIFDALLLQGELPRGSVATLLGTGSRQARRVTAALVARGAITARSTRAPLRLAVPATLLEQWLPGAFPRVSSVS